MSRASFIAAFVALNSFLPYVQGHFELFILLPPKKKKNGKVKLFWSKLLVWEAKKKKKTVCSKK